MRTSHRKGRFQHFSHSPFRTILLAVLMAAAICTVVSIQHRSAKAQTAPSQVTNGIGEKAQAQISILEEAKRHLSASQKKLDSHIFAAVRAARGALPDGMPTPRFSFESDSSGRVMVDIAARVRPVLLSRIHRAGGDVISSFPEYDSVRAWLPMSSIEPIAGLKDIRFIRPAEKAVTDRVESMRLPVPLAASERDRSLVERLASVLNEKSGASVHSPNPGPNQTDQRILPQIGTVTTRGDIAHRAAEARSAFHVNGSGVRVGVLSDSFNFLAGAATDVANGDLPGPGNPNGFTTPVQVIQDNTTSGTDEGRAMLQIIHDLAPGAQLFFATGDLGTASFASNIIALKNAGCNIIVDDERYFSESPFQDSIVAQAVNQVTAAGVMYFASAGNNGNLTDSTSSVWEGDFADGGANFPPISVPGRVHDFGGGHLMNTITGSTTIFGPRGDLFWADRLGGSTNDYDLFLLSADGTTVVDSSTNVQDGFQDPYESVNFAAFGENLVVLKVSGQDRFLNLSTGGGILSLQTSGQARGHSCAANAFAVAAEFVINAGSGPFRTSVPNPLELFSSDGPRHVFFNPDGTPITIGNFSSTGGAIRLKPDLTAADGVVTTVLSPFFGTSAAAPHAAAIATLLLSFDPRLSPSQVRTALTGTALDIATPGWDRDYGFGIVMAVPALQSVPAPNYIGFIDVSDCNSIGGWAADTTRLNTSINLSIFDDSTLVAIVPAFRLRTDVGAVLGDNGLHGFTLPIPASLKDGNAHTIHVRFENSLTDLSGSPVSLTCSAAATNYTGFIDVKGCNNIGGWVADLNRLNQPISVSIYDGPILLVTLKAGQLRTDVGAFLGDNGLHGFSTPTPSALKTGTAHSLHLKFETGPTEMNGSPTSSTCP